jgi:hypothetical protein
MEADNMVLAQPQLIRANPWMNQHYGTVLQRYFTYLIVRASDTNFIQIHIRYGAYRICHVEYPIILIDQTDVYGYDTMGFGSDTAGFIQDMLDSSLIF